MSIDELFTRTETDVRKIQQQSSMLLLTGTFKEAKVFNDTCALDNYDMMIAFEHGSGFKDSHEKKMYLKNFIGRFEEYLNVIYPEHSSKFIIDDTKHEFEVIWWINHPRRFKEFLKLLRYIDKYVKSYWGSWTNTGVQIVTADNRHNLKNLRVLIPPFGRMFEFNTPSNFADQVKYNIKNNFVLFWNNLHQQQDFFRNKYYGNEIYSIDSFIRVFSDFAARELVYCLSILDKNLVEASDYDDLNEIVKDILAVMFETKRDDMTYV